MKLKWQISLLISAIFLCMTALAAPILTFPRKRGKGLAPASMGLGA